MRVHRLCIIGLLGISLMLAAPPRWVWACSCVWPSLETAFDEATAVFVATEVERESPFGTFADGVGMKVERVWKGEVPRMIYLVAGEYKSSDGTYTSSSCDWLPQGAGRYLVFATEQDGYFESWSCSGSSPWDGEESPELFEALVEAQGEGKPPNEVLRDHVAPPTSAQPISIPTNTVPAYAAPDAAVDSQPSASVPVRFTPWLLVVLLASLLGLVGVAALRKHDRG